MAQVNLVYGNNIVNVNIPDRNLIMIASPKSHPGVRDTRLETRRALRESINTPKISEKVRAGDQVAIIIDDWTRPTPCKDIVPAILDELVEGGVREKDVTVVMGLGMRPMVGEDLIKNKVGEEVYGRVKVVVHDCDDEDNMVYCGMTSLATPVWINKLVADATLRIGVGNIVPHFGIGYAGGGKIILPGVCSRDTIERNHFLYFCPSAYVGNIQNNPYLEDTFEAARLAKLDIVVNTILNGEGQVVRIFAGDVRDAWSQGVELSKQMLGFKNPEKADVVITTPGFTYDVEIESSLKSLCCAERIVKANATLIVFSKCWKGLGGWKEFYGSMKMEPLEIIKSIQRKKISVIAGAAYKYVIINRKFNTILVTDGVSKNNAKAMGFDYTNSIEEALEKAFAKHGKDARISVLTHGSVMVPIES